MNHSTEFYLLLIAGLFAVTFPARWAPLALFTRLQIPATVKDWLNDIPTTIFAAILLQTLWSAAHVGSAAAQAPLWYGTGTAFLVGLRTKSLLYGTLGGAGGFLLMRWVCG